MRWRDVDLQAATASLSRVRLNDGSIIPAGNSKHKRRLLPLPPQAVEALKAQQRWQTKMRDEQARDGLWLDTDGLVFTNEWGEPVRQSTLHRAFKRMLAEAGILPARVRIHDLRHTGATLLLLAGVPVRIVQDLLGHSTSKMTLDIYGHVTATAAREGAERLGQLLDHTQNHVPQRVPEPSKSGRSELKRVVAHTGFEFLSRSADTDHKRSNVTPSEHENE